MSRKYHILFPLSGILALCICMTSGNLPAAAKSDGSGFDHFQKQNTFAPGLFTDVTDNDWFYNDVKTVYELGLMLGGSDSAFMPEGNVTIAQTIAVAARIHALYETGSADLTQGRPWYQVYVDYASANGIPTSYENYGKQASRAEYAQILSTALPEAALEPINQIEDGAIPDIPETASYVEAVYQLYRAGILLGVDDAGTFRPDSGIRRGEVAAIVSRMADPSARMRKDLTLTDHAAPQSEPGNGASPDQGQTVPPQHGQEQVIDPGAGHQQGTAIPGQTPEKPESSQDQMGSLEDGQTPPGQSGESGSTGSPSTEPTFTVQTVEASPGDTDVAVTIRADHNPGLASIGMLVSYDSTLTLKSVSYNQDVGGQSMLPPAMISPVKLVWISPLQDVEGDWIFATLYFDIPDNVPPGTYQVAALYDAEDLFNIADESVHFAVVNGAIIVS